MSTVTPRRPAASRSGGPGPRPGGRSPASARTIDPFRVLRRHVLLVVASVFIGAGLGVGAFYTLRKEFPLYQAAVIFEVQAGIAEADTVSTSQTLRDEDVARIGNTQLLLIVSRPVLETAVKTSDVRRTTWFKKNYADSTGEKIQEAVDHLAETLKPGVLRGTELFELRWATHDKEDTAIVLNAIAESYIDRRKLIDEAVYTKNLEHFQRQLDETNRDIDDLDREIKEYIIEAGITSLDDPRYSQSATAIQEITTAITAAQSQFAYATTIYKQDQAKLEGALEYSPEDFLQAENDYAVAQSIRQVESLKVELRVLRADYPQDENHQVRKAESRLRAAEAVYREKLDEVIRRNLTARIRDTANRIEQLRQNMDQLESDLETKGDELRALAAQQSQFESMRNRREYLERSREGDLQLTKEIRLMRLRDDARLARVQQFAETPRDLYFPKLIILVPLFVLLATGATVGIVFLRELTDQRVKSAADLAVLPGAEIVGVIPDLEDDPTRPKTAELAPRVHAQSVLAESCRQATAIIIKGMEFAGHQTAVLFSGMPGAGTTTSVANIGSCLAAAGRRVLVVDANFRRPRLAGIFGLDQAASGLGDLLAGATSADEAIHRSDEGCDVLGAGTPASRVVERLSGERFAEVVAELRSRYDIVLFDAPPAVVAGDALAIASRLDAAVLVVRANQEQRGLVARLVGQVDRTGCSLLGLLLNRPRGTAGGYFKKNYAAMAAYGDAGGKR